MPLQATSGAASYDGFGGGVVAEPNYIESVFSTYLYTGNGSTQTITNGVDLSTKGGLVWTKGRAGTASHRLVDTSRGVSQILFSNLTNAQSALANGITSFNSNGYSLGTSSQMNGSTEPFVSWTWAKAPKFFDVVTYTGNGSTQTISHNLGSVPGCIMVKKTSGSSTYGWFVYHRGLSANQNLLLNTTDAVGYVNGLCATTPTSTTFSVDSTADINGSGATYVAYLFAHDAGGFGLTGTDNVISCGSFTTNGSGNATVSLGYEPQWLMVKCAGTAGGDDNGNWRIVDSMRGFPTAIAGGTYAASATLYPNTSGAEEVQGFFACNSTGFSAGQLQNSKDYIYIAIRRGPMKVPTSGTSVFAPVIRTGTSTAVSVTGVGFPPDMMWSQYRDSAGNDNPLYDKLRGPTRTLFKNSTMAEQTPASYGINSFDQDGVSLAANQGYTNNSGSLFIYDFFRRAPSFFDEVCYTGTGANRTISHNLAAVPELMITKQRSGTSQWNIYQANLGASAFVQFTTAAVTTGDTTRWNGTAPTASVFSLGTSSSSNSSGQTYVAYLFATCAGVSKCTAFTGNGSSQTINCGFTSGARFVMIKATSTTGNWTIFDSARGISAGGDPALYLNSTAAEVTGVDAIDADSTGFIVNQEGTFNLNASGVQYLVLAIA